MYKGDQGVFPLFLEGHSNRRLLSQCIRRHPCMLNSARPLDLRESAVMRRAFEGPVKETVYFRIVLNEIMARPQNREVFYWRDKRGHEVDFVIATHQKRPAAIECKWSANNFDPTNLIAFWYQHPEGDNLVLAQDVERAFTRSYGDLGVRFDGIRSFTDSLSS